MELQTYGLECLKVAERADGRPGGGVPKAGATYFTLVFEGDITQFEGNVFKTATPFGRPVAAGVGNAFDVQEALIKELRAAET